MRSAVRVLTILTVAAGVAACEQNTRPVPELSFVHASPILLKVREAQIDSRYRSPSAPPNIEQTVSPTPEAAMIRWAQQRLRSDGTENIARFTILNAPLTAEALAKPSGLMGTFRSEAGQRWTVTVEAQLEILDEAGNRLDGYTAKVSRSRDMAPGLTSEERNWFWHDLLSATMTEFDTQMETGIRQHASRWMR